MAKQRALPNCPGCGNPDSVKEILWGEPAADYDEERYTLGGCLVTGDDPDLECLECGWMGFWPEG